MYQDFHATDRWTGQKLHCIYQALIVAIATRHADAIDIKFLVSGRPVWIAIKQGPDWRWMEGRSDSPWYPTAKLFRQTQRGRWEDISRRA